MPSGQQVAEQNFQLFDAWRLSKLDQDFRQMVTRAQRQVILVGDEHAARAAVQGLPRAKQRKVALGSVLTALMASIKEAP